MFHSNYIVDQVHSTHFAVNFLFSYERLHVLVQTNILV